MKYSISLCLFVILIIFLWSCNTGNTNKGVSTSTEDTTMITKDTIKEIQQPIAHDEGGIHYKTYNNNTYNYSVDYPQDILFPQGESGSGDGQIFKSKDETCTLWVYRDFRDNMSEAGYTIETAYKQDTEKDNADHPKREITYKHADSNSYVISGLDGNKIFYQKTIMKDKQLVTFLLEYKKKDKAQYQAITEHISRSFR